MKVLSEPCKKHKIKKLPYVQWHNWAEKKAAKGEKQTQCKDCGYWLFKEEI